MIAASRGSKDGPWEELYSFDSQDPHTPQESGAGLSRKLDSNHGPWHWLRYQSPPGSHGNIASLEFDGEDVTQFNCDGVSSDAGVTVQAVEMGAILPKAPVRLKVTADA